MKEQVEFAASWEQYLSRNTSGYVNMQIRVMLRSIRIEDNRLGFLLVGTSPDRKL